MASKSSLPLVNHAYLCMDVENCIIRHEIINFWPSNAKDMHRYRLGEEHSGGYTSYAHGEVIMEYLVNISKRRAFWSLNEDILKINDSDYQYAVSIKEDTAYPCLHSPKTTKETSSIRRIQRRPIRRIEDIVCEDSGRYQAWSLLQETPNTPYPTPWIRRIEPTSRQYK
ncbi:hypothetical protein Tco_0724667 [Tanacetum coccineum]